MTWLLHQARWLLIFSASFGILLFQGDAAQSFVHRVNTGSANLNGVHIRFTPSMDGKVWATITIPVAITTEQIKNGDGSRGLSTCKIIDPDPLNITANEEFQYQFTHCSLDAGTAYKANVYIEDDDGNGVTHLRDFQVPADGGIYGDPVTYVGDEKVEFVLPQYALTTLLETPELRVLAEPLPRDGRKEQWIGRVLVTTVGPRPEPVVDVKIKRLIGWFNRTTAHPDGIETIDVKMDWFLPGRPLRIMPPSDAVFNHPKGMSIVVSRMRYTGYELDPRLPRREIVFIAGRSVKIAIVSTSANEYFGSSDMHAHLGTKFAHLDVDFFDMHGNKMFKGTLPEIWGFQPISQETKAMVKQPEEATSAESEELLKLPVDLQASGECTTSCGSGQAHATI